MTARKPAALAISIGAVIAALLGVLAVLHALAPDREAIRADLSRQLELLDQLPANDPARKDRRIEELMAVEDYPTHARALWLKLERLHGPVHQAARTDEESRKAVTPFLARCAALDGKTPADLRSLDDEARSLQDLYGATRYGPALAEVRGRLSSRMAAAVPACTEMDHFRVLQQAQKDRLARRHADALALLDGAVAKHPACDGFLFKAKQEREALIRSAAQAAAALLEQARKVRKEEGVRLLEQALSNFKGLPDEGRLRALLVELRRP